MRTRTGERVDGLKFFELLAEDAEFCAELGRAVLAAGRLESALKRFLATHAPAQDVRKATLGKMIQHCRQHRLLTKMIPILEDLAAQRNYLTHSIHALLSDLIEETTLERSGLIDSDVSTYTDRVWQLKENLNGIARILERE